MVAASKQSSKYIKASLWVMRNSGNLQPFLSDKQHDRRPIVVKGYLIPTRVTQSHTDAAESSWAITHFHIIWNSGFMAGTRSSEILATSSTYVEKVFQ